MSAQARRSLQQTAAAIAAAALGQKIKPVTIPTHSEGERLIMETEPIPTPTAAETKPAIKGLEYEGTNKAGVDSYRQVPTASRPEAPAGSNRKKRRRYENAHRVTFGMAVEQAASKAKAIAARRKKKADAAAQKKKARR